jgi:hypothetical protein
MLYHLETSFQTKQESDPTISVHIRDITLENGGTGNVENTLILLLEVISVEHLRKSTRITPQFSVFFLWRDSATQWKVGTWQKQSLLVQSQLAAS